MPGVDLVTDLAGVPGGVHIRQATPGDLLDIVRLLDAALLTNEPAVVERRTDAGDVFVAVRNADAADFSDSRDSGDGPNGSRSPSTSTSTSTSRSAPPTDGAKLGVVVLTRVDRALHIDAITTRHSSRGRGIATGLIKRSVSRARDLGYGLLTAQFRPPLRDFYASRDFTVYHRDGRGRGYRRISGETQSHLPCQSPVNRSK